MKIKTKVMPYEKVMELPKEKAHRPIKPNIFFRTLIRVLSIPDLCKTHFKYTTERMDEIGDSPCLILMNHSSFIDLKIAYKIFYPKPLSIICTSDGFVGKNLLMRLIGCIPTNKFVTDLSLISNINYALKKKKSNVLMYPEASYSFDGCATPLPKRLGTLLKKLDVPVVTVITEGAFARDPLYNGLQLRKVNVSAKVCCLFSKEDLKNLSAEELDRQLNEKFSFDNFRWQQENKIKIDEPFRADGLNRILYKCAHCGAEGTTLGKGTKLVCSNCKKEYELDVYGNLQAADGETKFNHIPDWFNWERECVLKEITDGTYKIDCEVDIGMLVNHKAIYMVGEGHLTHTADGFNLVGCDGKLNYSQKPAAAYSLYSDYNWYEIGDVICIGDKKTLYYCFPKNCGDVVAKARLATEEMFKLNKTTKA